MYLGKNPVIERANGVSQKRKISVAWQRGIQDTQNVWGISMGADCIKRRAKNIQKAGGIDAGFFDVIWFCGKPGIFRAKRQSRVPKASSLARRRRLYSFFAKAMVDSGDKV